MIIQLPIKSLSVWACYTDCRFGCSWKTHEHPPSWLNFDPIGIVSTIIEFPTSPGIIG